MTRIDYAEVGLRVGLEVHQQLATDRKMFCNCPAGLYTRDHDGVVLRHMRPTLSELGEYDGTALMEFKTKKNIVYLLHKDNVCTYEMDDTPPFLVNQQALDIAIEQCLMLGCDIVDEVHIARKQYLDGSIPTGFQRTAIVGVGGGLPFRGRTLHVTQVSVEEDSCREVADQGHLIVWRADRLGMPLIETVTEPELTTPDEVEEAILLIGRVCRSTGHVRVGMGASRQDVNVSVRGGRRVEIKGVPQAWRARLLVDSEAWRQVRLLELRDELHRRGFRRAEDIGVEHRDVTRTFASSELPTLRRETWERFLEERGRRPDFERGEGPFCVRAVRLPGLAGTLSWPTQPDHTFADELAGRIRVIATLDQPPILLHSEKWPDYLGGRQELRRLRKRLGCGTEDAMVLIWGAEADTVTAADEIRLRYADATGGIPHETRQPLDDGTTTFERILPGPERMYPDTDSPPQRVDRERVESLRVALPEPPWEREARYTAAGVPVATVHYLIRRRGAELVDRVVDGGGDRRAEGAPENDRAEGALEKDRAEGALKKDLRRACFFFGERLRGLRRGADAAGIDVDAVPVERWIELFRAAGERPVLWEAWKDLTVRLCREPSRSVAEIVGESGLGEAPGRWRQELAELASERPTYPDEPPDGSRGQRHRFLLDRAMARWRGRVPAADVDRAIGDLLEDEG